MPHPLQTILIVDDNLEVCRPMATLIRHLGYDGRYATGGEAALAAAQQAPPALVILDVMMPGMDGLEVLARLKADDRTRGVPVVMYSAVTDPEYKARASAAGAVDYWVKAGISYDDLRVRIAGLVPKPTGPQN